MKTTKADRARFREGVLFPDVVVDWLCNDADEGEAAIERVKVLEELLRRVVAYDAVLPHDLHRDIAGALDVKPPKRGAQRGLADGCVAEVFDGEQWLSCRCGRADLFGHRMECRYWRARRRAVPEL